MMEISFFHKSDQQPGGLHDEHEIWKLLKKGSKLVQFPWEDEGGLLDGEIGKANGHLEEESVNEKFLSHDKHITPLNPRAPVFVPRWTVPLLQPNPTPVATEPERSLQFQQPTVSVGPPVMGINPMLSNGNDKFKNLPQHQPAPAPPTYTQPLITTEHTEFKKASNKVSVQQDPPNEQKEPRIRGPDLAGTALVFGDIDLGEIRNNIGAAGKKGAVTVSVAEVKANLGPTDNFVDSAERTDESSTNSVAATPSTSFVSASSSASSLPTSPPSVQPKPLTPGSAAPISAQPQQSPKSPPVLVNTSASEAGEVTSPKPRVEEGSSTQPAVNGSSPQQSMPKSSWAGLFSQNKSSPNTQRAASATLEQPVLISEPVQVKPANEIGALLTNFKLNHAAVIIQPRRFINRANWCYINATLQALLACPPFYHMLRSLPSYPQLSSMKSVTPVLDAMTEFFNQFNSADKTTEKPGKKGKSELKCGQPIEPTDIYDVLPKMKENLFQRGRQEDAEEFLSCLFNTLHEEIGEAVKQNEKQLSNKQTEDDLNGHPHSEPEEDEGTEWCQVVSKKKSIVTHSNKDKLTTPISQIFGGLLRSSLYANQKESSVLEPFFTVPLHVEHTAGSVENALKAFVTKEEIDGYTCPSTKQQLDAHRRFTFEELPPILILHLKCFVYDKHGGSQKIMHKTKFSDELIFEKELLSTMAQQQLKRPEQRSYKLFAVVYHSGEKTTGGHYHTDVFHTGERCWVRFDDDHVKRVSLSQVLDDKQKGVPYLLCFKRKDTIPTTNTNPSSLKNSTN